MREAIRGIRRAALAGVAAAGLGLVPAVADATPGAGVTARILAQTTVGGKDYVLREITIAPGGKTGWHYHDGTLYAFVKQGTLTHSDATCELDGLYKTGATFTEPSNQVHIGRNLGKKQLVLEVLYVNPAGAPLSQDAPNPGCDFE
ncbi:cupin domain-containing protein [Kribbella catacumbae]|uniref:cupin domain-containing protein n=1 Tax=Kribbella catacumbae TaxID=460086 RepID=UPI00036DBC53|nr:cupin domain-containing protein [Kribbella catacumbae]